MAFVEHYDGIAIANILTPSTCKSNIKIYRASKFGNAHNWCTHTFHNIIQLMSYIRGSHDRFENKASRCWNTYALD